MVRRLRPGARQGRRPAARPGPEPLAALFPDSLRGLRTWRDPRAGWWARLAMWPNDASSRATRPNRTEHPYIALEHMPKRCIALSEWGVANGLESNKFQFQANEILFGKLRPYFHKVGVAPVDGVCSTDIVVVAPRSEPWFGFVLEHISSDAFVEFTDAGSTGTKMPRTSWQDMARYPIVIPPRAVAHAYASRILSGDCSNHRRGSPVSYPRRPARLASSEAHLWGNPYPRSSGPQQGSVRRGGVTMDFWAGLSSFLARWEPLWICLTAFGTIAMAVTTFVVIRQAMRQQYATEQQHRDRFQPICVLVPFSGVDPLNRRGELIEKIDPSPENPSFGTLAIKCVLRNLGRGPALELRIKLRFLDMDGWTTEPWELAPLGAGEARGTENSPLLVPVRIHEKEPLNPTDFSQVAGKLWEIWLEYQDVFGGRFCSVHHKRPVRMEEGLKPLSGSAEEAGQHFKYAGQAWITFPKCRAS